MDVEVSLVEKDFRPVVAVCRIGDFGWEIGVGNLLTQLRGQWRCQGDRERQELAGAH